VKLAVAGLAATIASIVGIVGTAPPANAQLLSVCITIRPNPASCLVI
jgi:hypothetical protein